MPIADYKQFLNLRAYNLGADRTYHLGYYPAKAANTSALYAEPTVGLPNAKHLMCGWCDQPYLQHPTTDVWGDVLCSRPLSDFFIDSDLDYYADTHTSVKDSQPTNYYDSDQDYEGDYDYAADTYRDEYPDEFTSATHWWTNVKPVAAYRNGSRQAVGNLPKRVGESAKGAPVYVDGFLLTAVQVFDTSITQRLNLKFFNFYVDTNTGDTRLGGLLLTRTGSMFYAKCVRNDWTTNRCNSKVLSIDTETATLAEMQDFTLAVIRHGNNHAAPWFTNRAAYYKVHTETCDLTCSPHEATCTSAKPSLELSIQSLAHHINESRVA